MKLSLSFSLKTDKKKIHEPALLILVGNRAKRTSTRCRIWEWSWCSFSFSRAKKWNVSFSFCYNKRSLELFSLRCMQNYVYVYWYFKLLYISNLSLLLWSNFRAKHTHSSYDTDELRNWHLQISSFCLLQRACGDEIYFISNTKKFHSNP